MSKDVIETYRDPRGFWLNEVLQKEPSAFNSQVRVRKYRVTVELIDEPDDVIRDRIQKLWNECTNHHQWPSLRAQAKKYGLTLNHRAPNRRSDSERPL